MLWGVLPAALLALGANFVKAGGSKQQDAAYQAVCGPNTLGQTLKNRTEGLQAKVVFQGDMVAEDDDIPDPDTLVYRYTGRGSFQGGLHESFRSTSYRDGVQMVDHVQYVATDSRSFIQYGFTSEGGAVSSMTVFTPPKTMPLKLARGVPEVVSPGLEVKRYSTGMEETVERISEQVTWEGVEELTVGGLKVKACRFSDVVEWRFKGQPTETDRSRFWTAASGDYLGLELREEHLDEGGVVTGSKQVTHVTWIP